MFEPPPRLSQLEVSLVSEPPFLFLGLRGELDMCSVAEMPSEDYSSRRDLKTVLIDLGGLGFCDSSGLRGLMAFRRIHAVQGRSVAVARATPRIWRLMQVCGVTDRLEVAPPDRTPARVIAMRPGLDYLNTPRLDPNSPRLDVFRPVADEAIMTKAAATMAETIQAVQSTPGPPWPPNTA